MDFNVIHLDAVDSTNRWLADAGLTGSVCVWTDFQTAGRGCGANSWESQAGKNLLFSMLIHPSAMKAASQFRISMAAALAVVRAVEELGVEGLSIKWPNDVYWHDRKLGGILIENSLTAGCVRRSIIGVGLNVNQKQFVSDAPNPVSLRQIVGHELDREQLLQRVLCHFVPDISADEYRQRLYRRTGVHRYKDADGPFEASIVTVEDDGHLLLRDGGGSQRRYAFKEVVFLLPSVTEEPIKPINQ